MIERETAVDTAMGPLSGVIAIPDGKPGSGLVLVDGSGPATRDAWGAMPRWFAEQGVATLRHDKPGCGGSPGDWRQQRFSDRAAEALAAAATLRAESGATAVGLIGYSQGGWIALLAAATEPRSVDFVVTISGPGVGVAEQERVRIERALRRAGFDEDAVDDALDWVDERAARLAIGEEPSRVLADQTAHAAEPWYGLAIDGPYSTAEELAFAARALTFDPATVVPHVRCPILACFGAADDLVPVERSVAVLAERLPALHRGANGLVVFPGADHMLYVEEPRPGVDRISQLAPGFLPVLADFLARRQLF